MGEKKEGVDLGGWGKVVHLGGVEDWVKMIKTHFRKFSRIY